MADTAVRNMLHVAGTLLGHLDSFEHLLLNMKRRFGAAVIVPKVPGSNTSQS